MWPFRRRIAVGFPTGFQVQRIASEEAKALARHAAPDIVAYFCLHTKVAEALLAESYDKRLASSSFIEESEAGYEVGWYSSRTGYGNVNHFSDLADAATDYLLFSLGIRRWTGHEDQN